MRYRVTAQNQPFPGRHRDGRYYLNGEAVVLEEGEVTATLLQDRKLRVESLADAEGPDPAAAATRPIPPRDGRQPQRPRRAKG
jgi:hypothetical protein